MKRYFLILLLLINGAMDKASAGVLPVELLIDGAGKLAGAKNVLVQGARYDVAFSDGTCAQIFGGCDASSDFPVVPDGLAAAQALLDQVLLGAFDTRPTLTNGCEFSILCVIVTPISVSTTSDAIGWALANNGDDDRVLDKTESGGNAARSALDFKQQAAYVWAVWSPSATAHVPEPASLGLVLLGLWVLARHRAAQG